MKKKVYFSSNEFKELGAINYCFLLYLRQKCNSKDFTKLTSSKISQDIDVDMRRQSAYLKVLKEKGYIEIEHRDLPKKRYVKLLEKEI